MGAMSRRAVRRVLVLVAAVVTGMAVLTGVAAADLPSKPAQTWGTNGRVSVILPVGDQVFLGGSFSAVVDPSGKSYPASNIAVISATTGAADLSWQASANGQVTAMTALGSKLYVGGYFSKMNGQNRAKLAALDISTGALDPTWTPSTSAPVDAMGAGNNSVYVSGLFTTVTDSAGVHSRAYAAKLDATTGNLDTAWTPAPNDRTRALVLSSDGSRVYLGGDFTSVSGKGSSTRRIAAVSATGTGAVITTFRSVANNGSNTAPINDLATDGTNVYEAVGGGGGACTGVNAATGAFVWSKRSNGNLQAVRYSNGIVYCGGHFSGTGSFDGQNRKKLAAVSATYPYATTSFAPAINSALGVWSLASDANHLFAGGDFTKVSGVAARHYAEFVDGAAQTVPSAPTLAAPIVGNNVVHLSWSPPASDGGSPIQRYAVYRKAAGSTSYGRAIAKVSTGTTYDDTAVTNGTTYTYAISAINAVGEGPLSNEVQATPQNVAESAPGAPTGLTATAGSGSVVLAWSAPSNTGNSPITGYKLYRGTASGAETLLAAPTGTATTYTDGTVTSGTTYYYRVAAVNAIGTGPLSNEVSTSGTAGVPSAPTLSGSIAKGVAHLSWTAPASDGGSPIIKWVVVRDGIRLATVKSTFTYDDTTVVSGTTYVYQVRAVNAVGAGKYSNKVTLTAP